MKLNLPLITAGVLLSCLSAACTKSGSKHVSTSRGASQTVLTPLRPWDSSTRRTVRTTAYSHMENEPGAHGRLSASGNTLKYGRVRSAAADWSRYPLGTQFKIVGTPHLYEIDDYGSALVGTDTIDLFKPNLRLMKDWGSRHVEIKITKWGSFEQSNALLEKRLKYPHCRTMHRHLQPQLRRERSGR
ncbi:MAG: hypothetical protein P1U89_23505 [Verrucomicrobiales bacterium]|nr:hypothetical protein [Verrucomicrobiales bacterium]